MGPAGSAGGRRVSGQAGRVAVARGRCLTQAFGIVPLRSGIRCDYGGCIGVDDQLGGARCHDPEPPGAADRGRITPLDGMRAFAVTAVILYHALPSWAIGGYFGVDVFFVLSGYLITSLLLVEWRDTGGVALRSFWARRARRLLPALFLMLAVVGVVAVLLPQVLGSPGLLGDTAGHGRLRRQLAPHGRPHQLLRHGGQPVAAPAHLVAGHRGAVLPGVAPGRPGPGGRPAPPARRTRRQPM